jgi:hypothetical protein
MMKKNNLILLWHEIHAENKEDYKLNIKEIDEIKHSKIISKILFDQKLKILLYFVFLAVYLCLMIYGFIYLKLNLSFYSLIPLSFVGLFILIKNISEVSRFIILIKTKDNFSIKESAMFFLKKLNRIGTTDFLSYLILFYTMATGTTLVYLKEIGGIKYISWENGMTTLILIFILLLLFIPWFMKYQHNHRYKELYSSLWDSLNFLNEES